MSGRVSRSCSTSDTRQIQVIRFNIWRMNKIKVIIYHLTNHKKKNTPPAPHPNYKTQVPQDNKPQIHTCGMSWWNESFHIKVNNCGLSGWTLTSSSTNENACCWLSSSTPIIIIRSSVNKSSTLTSVSITSK